MVRYTLPALADLAEILDYVSGTIPARVLFSLPACGLHKKA